MSKKLKGNEFKLSEEQRSELLTSVVTEEGKDLLNESQRNKVADLFEISVNETVSAICESRITQIENYADDFIEQQVNEQVETRLEQLDAYIERITSEWAEENKPEIQNAIQARYNDKLVGELKDVLNKFNIVIPEDKTSVIENMAEEIENLESQNEKLVNEAIERDKDLKNKEKIIVLGECLADLSDAKAAKIISLTEDTEFVSAEDYKIKVMKVRNNLLEENNSDDTNDEDNDSTQMVIESNDLNPNSGSESSVSGSSIYNTIGNILNT